MTDSDSDTFSESSSSEYQEDIDYLYGGQARSILSSLEESIGKIDDFLSFERTFVYGDVVCSLSDPSGQMGRVTGVDVLVDLENVKGNILKNVNSKTLLKIRSISEGDYVIKGPWLGQVQRVVDKVTVLLDDGLKCEIIALGKEKLLPVTHHILEDSQYLYYPGQRVKVNSATVSKSARWICGTWRDNKDEGTVCAVEAGLVYVEWLASALLVSNVNVSSPPSWQDSENLTLLSCFSHANWQLSDWCMLQVADQKELMEQLYLSNEHGMTQGYGRRKLNSNVGELFIVSKKKTKVDIIWQNGEHTLGLDPQNLVPVNVINTHEFWPHQFVLEKGASSDDLLKPSSQRWGVVLSMDAKERTVNVQWKTVPVSEPDNLAVDTMIETVSAYELVEHPDFSFCFGDIVFKDQQELAYPADKDNAKPMTDVNLVAPLIDRDQNQNNFPGNCYLSCIGNVTGFKDGDVEVKWATGLTTKVAPSEIFRIDKHESSTVTPNPYEANLEELPQEMNEHGSPPSDQKGKGLLNFDGGRENCDQHSGESSSFSLPQMAYEFFSSIKTSIFQTLGVTSLSRAVSLVPTFDEGNGSNFLGENVLDTCDPCTESHSMNGLQSTEDRRTPYDEVTMTHERNDFPVSSGNNSPDRLKQFDIIDNCSDHHFFDEGKGLALSQVKSGWVKKVQQEWSILENNLPESIYVRVFEERMDLMRAAIVGASGTPYHDGLFFFDICFPLGYPSEPPMVHFNSGGLRLNPNLYESGKVCLSLLNTWTGTSTEVWNPGTSTILQVLISLQALVLNDKPYFNEAGYDQQIGRAEGERNSVSYNENAFLVTCKSMLYLLRKPPKHFEAVVEEHFRQRSRHILVACNAYLEGVTIGCGFGSGNHEDENQKVTSTGFKIMLGKLFPKLVEAFSNKGIDCNQFNELHK